MTPILSSTLLRTQSDARLVELASGGSERAFEAIVERYRRPLLRFCRRVLPEQRAEDAVQRTFLNAWSALGTGVEIWDLRPWLYKVAHNAALDQLKARGYDYDELSDSLRVGGSSDEELERRRVMRETLAGVAALPTNQREALLRTAVEGASRAEVARELHVSEGAVRQLVHRARTTLRAAATAITPAPLASWAVAASQDAGGPMAQRVAELVAGAGSAGAAASVVKAGTVVVAAGVLAAGPGDDLREEVTADSSRAAAEERTADREDAPDKARTARGLGLARSGRTLAVAHRRSGHRGRRGDGDDPDSRDHSGPGDGDRVERVDNSGPGSLSSDGSGELTSGSSGSGSSGSGSSGSGSSGSGSSGSGSGTSGSGSSGSGELTSGSSGSGSSGSGSGSGDDTGLLDNSGSGSSGSGSGSSGSGSSGPG